MTSTSPRPSCCRVGARRSTRRAWTGPSSGGAFRSTGTLTVTNSRINGNTAFGTGASGGGAIINTSGTLRVSNASMDGNSATRAGGAIEANASTTSLDRVRLTNNDTGPTPGNGGGLHLTGTGSVSVSNSSVMGNTASEEGGGLWNSATGTMSVQGSRIVNNSANGTSGSGGGLLNNLGTLSASSSMIDRNSATRAGGGIEANVGSTTTSR